jgi:tRNA G18 (ribose-2'-O)-methylase SpoU
MESSQSMIDRTIPIHDRDDPRIAPYLDQKDAWLRAAHHPDRTEAPQTDPSPTPPFTCGLFMAEGSLVVEHLLASPYAVHSVLVSQHRLDAMADLLARVPPETPIYTAPRALIAAIVGFDVHRGLLACGLRPPPTDPARLASRCRALVVLEDLANHDNLGSIFRSAAVLAGQGVGVLLSPRCCDPLYRKALRVSMGHALRIPFAVVDDWPTGLTVLAAHGFDIMTLDSHPDAEPIDEAAQAPPARPALIFGAEGPGLSPAVRALGLRAVTIPQAPGVDSLNIAVAAAVALHRLVRPNPA